MGAYSVPQRPVMQKGVKATKTPLRGAARGEGCTLRLPCCRHDPDYVVLAHLRYFSWAGFGQKPNDILGIFACDRCHAEQEARRVEYEEVLRALGETLLRHIETGHITINTRKE